jgi:hypothetical protein
MAVFSHNRDFAGCRTKDSNPGCTVAAFAPIAFSGGRPVSRHEQIASEEVAHAKWGIEQILLVSRNRREGSCFDAEISCEREKKHTFLSALLRRSIVAAQ